MLAVGVEFDNHKIYILGITKTILIIDKTGSSHHHTVSWKSRRSTYRGPVNQQHAWKSIDKVGTLGPKLLETGSTQNTLNQQSMYATAIY